MALKAKTYLSVVGPVHPEHATTVDRDSGKTRPTRPGDSNYKPRTRFMKPGELIPDPLDPKVIDEMIKKGEKVPSHLTQSEIDDLVSQGIIVDESELHLGQEAPPVIAPVLAPIREPDAGPEKSLKVKK